MLCVVPQPGDRVPVVVVHDVAGRTWLTGRACTGGGAGRRGELVHGAIVEGGLLGGVIVVLVARQQVVDVGRVETTGIGPVRIAGQEGRSEPVDRLGPRGCDERLTAGVGRVGVRPEVVIERNVLLKDHHEVLDGTWPLVLIRFGRALAESRQHHQGDQTQTGGADHHRTFHANEEFHSLHLRFHGKRCPCVWPEVSDTRAAL